MPSPTLSQLRALLAALDEGSLTAAARRLGVTQAAVSEQVTRLEETLNARLFARAARGLVPTAAASELARHARVAMDALEAGTESVRSLTSLEGGVSTFGVFRYASYYDLADLLLRFHTLHPEVRIRMIGVSSVLVAQSVRDGEVEGGLVVLPTDDHGLHVRPLVRDEVYFASTTRPAGSGPVTMEEVCAEPLVLYDAHAGWRDATRRQLRDRARLAGVDLNVRIEVEHAETAARLVAAGLGSSIFARTIGESTALAPTIRTFPFAEPLYDTLAVIRRQGEHVSPATAQFGRMAEAALVDMFRRRTDTSWMIER